jgi:hypothetical protein
MNDNGEFDSDCLPTAMGILRCLRALADEALALDLTRSTQALRAVAMMVEAESRDACGDQINALHFVASVDCRAN